MIPDSDAKPVRMTDPQIHPDSVRPRGFRASLLRYKETRLLLLQALCGKERDIEISKSVLEIRLFVKSRQLVSDLFAIVEDSALRRPF